MPINPNKDQQKAFAHFNQMFNEGLFKSSIHEGIVIREILTRYTVTKQNLFRFIQDCYVETGLLNHSNKELSEVHD